MRCCAGTRKIGAADLFLKYDYNLLTGIQSFRRYFSNLTSLEKDICNVMSAIYAVDLAVKRGELTGFIRDIKLNLTVVNYSAFQQVRKQLENLLYVLSKDNWNISFQRERGTPEKASDWPANKGVTLLFSGGLDSFCAAAQYLKEGRPLWLVSHVTQNQVVAQAQTNLHKRLEQFGQLSIPRAVIRVSGRSKPDAPFPQDKNREDTQRTRSLLFLALACLVARRTGHNTVVAIAENGQLAINLPLSAARVGPFSTQTAHPEFVAEAQDFFSTLFGYGFVFHNPYLYFTKSEVLSLLPSQLKSAIPESVSCWRASRVSTTNHCGECVPCLVRRVALESQDLTLSEYARDLLKEDISKLGSFDTGKRNLVELLEFVTRLNDVTLTDETLIEEFPEIVNRYVNFDSAKDMYLRFARETVTVFGRYQNIVALMQ
jgi:7-cyano-7-deazaguanine synthase in queuosine biosynthesis